MTLWTPSLKTGLQSLRGHSGAFVLSYWSKAVFPARQIETRLNHKPSSDIILTLLLTAFFYIYHIEMVLMVNELRHSYIPSSWLKNIRQVILV